MEWGCQTGPFQYFPYGGMSYVDRFLVRTSRPAPPWLPLPGLQVQLSGCSRVPRSPKCTMVSLSSPRQWLHLRPVPWRCSDVRSVTSNKRTHSLTGEQDVHT
ncbi:hypothetical protein EYF80_022958 [Liparis tanakae]|uniref:Uncharacterized protein n=1 Tax=Liparis tanakae TaxID=230148 RepID=A0A4Z2HLX1_9TELE|nr:hypothetical protein EYF80_022958 [Liparis tanakae]